MLVKVIVYYYVAFHSYCVGLIQQDELTLTERWATLRPEQISPEEFLYLTIQLYGERKDKEGDLQEPIETDNTQLELTSSAACEETDGMVIEETSCSMKQPHTSLLQRRRKNKQETEAGAPSEVVHAVNVPPHPDKSKYASCVVWRKALRNPEL